MVHTVSQEVPASRKEQAQWMLHRLVPGRGICNVGFALRVEHRLRWWPLQAALNHLVWRHPGLRATLHPSGSALYKRLAAPSDLAVPLDTLAATEDGLEAQITELVARPFDIEVGPLLRAYRLVLPTSDVICVVLHHVVGDAVTAGVLAYEMSRLYDAFAEHSVPPPELDVPAPVFVEEAPQHDTLDYWRTHLSGVKPDRLALAGARPAPTRPSFAGDRIERKLSSAARRAVERLRVRTRTTENVVLLAAYYLLLAKHGAGPDMVVGVMVNARRGGAPADVVGYHANTLPVRVAVDLAATFAAIVRQTRDAFLTGLDHGDASFESVQHSLDSRSADWRVPLFRHAFNYMPPGRSSMTIAGKPVRSIDADNGMSRVDLEFFFWSLTEDIAVTARFSTEVHDRTQVETLLARFDRLLVALDENDERPVNLVDCDTEADCAARGAAIGPSRSWPAVTVADAIEAQARANPAATAIGGRTYGELHAAAGAVATVLREHGVGPGDVVGLYAERGEWLAVGALGVWAAGAAYLPLDPGHPLERVAYELDDAGVRVVLTDRALPLPAARDRISVQLEMAGAGEAARQQAPPCAGADPAYVIYTSGSTGRPKGVVVSHANLTNVVRHFGDLLDMTADDRMLWLTTFSFDISALELFLPLVTGARVVAATDRDRSDPECLLRLVEEQEVSVLQATPTMWRHLAADLRGRLRGRRVLSGGEPLTPALAERLLADGCRLFNVYGPTETTIWSTATELTSPVPDPVPVGGPIANTNLRVTDAAGGAVPVGVPGELRIGGAGVATGYRGDPARTAQRFPVEGRHGRMYRTGDMVRQREDGGLEFLGRTDRQVKVRGHRVEPGEVEAVLEEHPEVRAAGVFVESDSAGHLRLVAAVQPAAVASGAGHSARPPQADDIPLPERLRTFVAGRLPAAMTPSRFLVLTELPSTGNSKIDYQALARIEVAEASEERLPDDPTQRTLLELWREVLGDQRLSMESNFFLSGGHSLLAVQLADRVAMALGSKVGFDLVFEAPTPALLAARLSDHEEPR
ncbi:non-ribosomal peptide synthetase [Micromonospora lupini]|uniref:non-ribosomal peptide synthetase n=1 Tax=Micromonospora lupini TaxID=285679 RepID=UPI0033E975DA